MSFAMEHMNMGYSEFWDAPPFAIINQMIVKADASKDKNDTFNRKEFIDMLRAANASH